ncbi:MAG: glutathione peroxidase [Deltaproteobacteria bacterium]|nr:glutathione peroxidase [Deltaproteobacteria bacterium]
MDLTALDGTSVDKASLEGKAVLFVNVASKCGYTGQYEGLQALYEAKKDEGLVIVGVPCNQFGGQEPGSKEEIATFCERNYGVTFPLLEKQDVNGKKRSALYKYLVGSEAGGNKDVRWNFEKFLVAKDGTVAGRFSSSVTPDSDELGAAIAAALQ